MFRIPNYTDYSIDATFCPLPGNSTDRPMGSLSAKYLRAADSFITTTFGVSSVSRSVSRRPRSSEIPRVSK